ncbi:MAG: TolC family protein [Prevotella sp.]|nr:TolC family protein [Prevotella sp.]
MKKVIALYVCLVSCSVMTAQCSLTLEECKRLARENNVSLQSARNDIQQAEEQCKEAFTNYFPQLSAMGVGMTANKNMVQMDLDLPSEMAAALPAGVTLPSSVGMMKRGFMGTVMAMQPAFAGGQIVNGNKLAKVGLEATRIQKEMVEDEVEQTVEQYYWQVVSIKEKLVTLALMKEMLKQLEKDVTVSVNAGVTTRNDLLKTQLKVNEIEQQILQAESGLAISSQLLAQYIGKNNESIIVAAPPLYDMTALQPQLYNHELALTGVPQYRLLEKNVESARLQHKMKIGENLPSVSAGLVYTYNDLMGEGRGVGVLMATVSVPISKWWGGSHAIKRQKLTVEQARNQLQDNSQKLIIHMNNCWANVETGYKQLTIARKSIEQAEENLRLNNNYYRAGTIILSDLLDAQSSYQQSRDKYVDTYIDYQLNVLKYRQALGL